jgi:hypothetical protein
MREAKRRGDTPTGSGIPIEELRELSITLSREDFEDQLGDAFLMLGGEDLMVPEGPGATVYSMPMPDLDETPAPTPIPEIHPVRRTGRSVGHLVAVGRTSNNDIVLPDVSVSRFHAFLKNGDEGRLQIQDAGSTNGTAVNGRPAPPRGEGAPLELKSGDRVRIGQVHLTFLDSESLIDVLRHGD